MSELIILKEDVEETKNKKDGIEKNFKNKDGILNTSITGLKNIDCLYSFTVAPRIDILFVILLYNNFISNNG